MWAVVDELTYCMQMVLTRSERLNSFSKLMIFRYHSDVMPMIRGCVLIKCCNDSFLKLREAIMRVDRPRGGRPQRHNISHFDFVVVFVFLSIVSLHFNRRSFFNNPLFFSFRGDVYRDSPATRASLVKWRFTSFSSDVTLFTSEYFIWRYFTASNVMMNVYVSVSYFNVHIEFVNLRRFG